MKFLTANDLRNKGDMVLITNACNMVCGGCNQMCPNIRAKDMWSIPLPQLINNLDTMTRFHKEINLFGGEPTTHPEWEHIKDTLYERYPEIDFWVFTNHPARCQCPLPEPEGNIHYHCENSMRETGHYLPTLVAPIDIYQVPDRAFYVRMAGKHCWMLNPDCSGLLYNNRAYFCQVAGAFEHATRTNYGWQFESGKDPFNRTQEDIIRQATSACYRCAFCLDPKSRDIFVQQQLLGKHSLVTTANFSFFKRRVKILTEKECLALVPDAVEYARNEWRQMRLEGG